MAEEKAQEEGERHFLLDNFPPYEDPNPEIPADDERWTQALLDEIGAKQFGGRSLTPEEARTRATGCRRRLCFVMFGDSLTEHGVVCEDGETAGWVTRLNVLYRRRADIYNRGMSGYNTRWAKRVLFKDVIMQFPTGVELVVIWLGANDTNVGDAQHVPADEYAFNLREIVGFWRCRPDFRTRPAEVMILGPPPINDSGSLVGGRSNARACEYSRIAFAVARESNAHFINVHASFHAYPEPVPEHAAGYAYNFYDPLGSPPEQDWPTGGEAYKELLQADGLHLTAKGQQRVYELLSAHIASALPHLSPKEAALDAPAPISIIKAFGEEAPFETSDYARQ